MSPELEENVNAKEKYRVQNCVEVRKTVSKIVIRDRKPCLKGNEREDYLSQNPILGKKRLKNRYLGAVCIEMERISKFY